MSRQPWKVHMRVIRKGKQEFMTKIIFTHVKPNVALIIPQANHAICRCHDNQASWQAHGTYHKR